MDKTTTAIADQTRVDARSRPLVALVGCRVGRCEAPPNVSSSSCPTHDLARSDENTPPGEERVRQKPFTLHKGTGGHTLKLEKPECAMDI